MSFEITTLEVKKFIIQTLALEDITVDDIADDMPLFEGGLGLDSIDALELVMALRKTYKVQLGEDASMRDRLQSVQTLTLALADAGREA